MTQISPIRIGTRKSALARVQTDTIRRELVAQGLDCQIVEIVSSGDKDHTTPLYALDPGAPGLFTKQLEAALLDRTVDLAVHSLKDLPTQQPPGLVVTAVPARANAADCLVVNSDRYAKHELFGLPKGAVVGTSSLRREAELLASRPDLKVIAIRGNVPTRVELAASGKVDAVMLAEAGLFRLGLNLRSVTKVALPTDLFVSAPGQGALALETRTDCPAELKKALATLHDADSEKETRIERRILRSLEGGCTLPLGVRCEVSGTSLSLRAFLGVTKPGTIRDWSGFHRFDVVADDEETLVSKTIQHFQIVIRGDA